MPNILATISDSLMALGNFKVPLLNNHNLWENVDPDIDLFERLLSDNTES